MRREQGDEGGGGERERVASGRELRVLLDSDDDPRPFLLRPSPGDEVEPSVDESCGNKARSRQSDVQGAQGRCRAEGLERR